MNGAAQAVVNASDAHLRNGAFASGAGVRIALEALPGELALVMVESRAEAASLADAFSGLAAPSQGRIAFDGRDWAELDDVQANARRARIGRLHSRPTWLPTKSLVDGIVLSPLHHGRGTADQLVEQAASLSQEFGLPGAPLGRPHELNATQRLRAAFARAFIGSPTLVLLELPTDEVDDDIAIALVNAARRVRDAHGAIIWFTRNHALWRDASMPVTRRYRLIESTLAEVNERSTRAYA